MKVKVAVLGSPSLIVLTVFVEEEEEEKQTKKPRSQSSGAVSVKIEVAVLGSPSLIARTVPLCCLRRASDGDLRLRSCVLMVSVDVKQHST